MDMREYVSDVMRRQVYLDKITPQEAYERTVDALQKHTSDQSRDWTQRAIEHAEVVKLQLLVEHELFPRSAFHKF